MSEAVAAYPDLYDKSPSGAPTLRGGHCRACGYVFFPPQSYGCESCGAAPEQLEAIALEGNGALSSFATVHLHQGKGIETPFTVGVIVLDQGPTVRGTLVQPTDSGLRIGDRMRAILAPAGKDDDGKDQVELRFDKMESR